MRNSGASAAKQSMMKLVIAILLIHTICSAALPQGSCRCRKATADDETIWGHIASAYEEERPVRSIRGTVRDPLDAPIEGALVEVFADNGKDRTPTSSTHTRVAACRVHDDGKFCFTGIKPGKYILAVGARGFNISFISITLNPKNRTSSGKGLQVNLQLGT